MRPPPNHQKLDEIARMPDDRAEACEQITASKRIARTCQAPGCGASAGLLAPIMRVLLLALAVACSGSPEPSDPPRERREQAGPPRPSQMEGEAPNPNSAPDPAETERADNEPLPNIAADDTRELVTPAVGQWVRYGVTWRSGGRSSTRYSIVDREAGGWWIEVEDRRGGTVREVRMHVNVQADGGTEVLALSFKRDGSVQEIPTRLLPGYQPMLAQWLVIIFPASLEGEPEVTEVAAGVFHGSFRHEEPLEFGTQQTNATLWRHPAVPLTGLVKLQDESGEHRMELIGFGLEGARSTF